MCFATPPMRARISLSLTISLASPHVSTNASDMEVKADALTVQRVGHSNRIPGTSKPISFFYFFKNHLLSGRFFNSVLPFL